jgi:hypothetical protein
MHAKHLMFEFFTTDVVFGHALAVVASDDASVLATLSSDIHTAWAFAYGSSLGHALRYTPSDCFETFPFPTHNEILRELGNQLTGLRRELSRVHDIGLTELYNRFHDPNWQQAEVTQMRDLQVSINLAVAAAYEWDDLDLGHGFHETKQGVRFTISESARREVLDRLLRLNHERYDEEVAQGLHDKGAKGRKKGTSSGRRKRAAGSVQPALNGSEGGDDA